MSVTLDQFISAWSGKKVPSRGGILGQCVSLVQHWAEDQGIGGTPVFPVPSAYLMAGKRADVFTWVANTPKGVPAPGDIVVFSNRVGGGHGHTGIVVSANLNTLDVFQQNDPMGSGAHTKRYNYANVLGWLRFKTAAPAPQQGVIMDTNAGRELYRTGLFREPENDSVGSAAQWNGRTPADALKVLRDAPEWQMNARKVKDYDVLAKSVQELSARPTKAELEAITNQLKASADRVAELEKQVQDNPDTQLLNESGSWLSKLFNRLFKGKNNE